MILTLQKAIGGSKGKNLTMNSSFPLAYIMNYVNLELKKEILTFKSMKGLMSSKSYWSKF